MNDNLDGTPVMMWLQDSWDARKPVRYGFMRLHKELAGKAVQLNPDMETIEMSRFTDRELDYITSLLRAGAERMHISVRFACGYSCGEHANQSVQVGTLIFQTYKRA